MSYYRWHHGVYALLTLFAGFSLGATVFTVSRWWALGALLLLLASTAWDAGEKQPGGGHD